MPTEIQIIIIIYSVIILKHEVGLVSRITLLVEAICCGCLSIQFGGLWLRYIVNVVVWVMFLVMVIHC